MMITLDGRNVWYSYRWKMWLQWYWIQDQAWWYEKVNIMPDTLRYKASLRQ